jgi:hypothetical protein
MTTNLKYEFTEGIGGGGNESYLLMLNGGISHGWQKKLFTKDQALKDAENIVNEVKFMMRGMNKVFFTNSTN